MRVIDLPDIGPISFYKRPRAKHFRITLKADGTINVTVPRLGTMRQAEDFVRSKQPWIEKQRAALPPVVPVSPAEIERLRAEAKAYIPERVQVLADEHDFDFNRITIKNMTSRWGSCSSKKNLNFSLHLMRLKSHYIDYVILHELSHTQEMNHGPRFWNLLESVCPGAKKIDAEMRQFGMLVG